MTSNSEARKRHEEAATQIEDTVTVTFLRADADALRRYIEPADSFDQIGVRISEALRKALEANRD
jgi:hypothetical protein